MPRRKRPSIRPAAEDDPLFLPAEREDSAPVAPVLRAVAAHHQRMLERVEELAPPCPEDVQMELAAVSRLAVLAGDLDVAVKGYKALGELMGMTSGPTHNHLHLHQTPANMLDAPDAALADLVAAAKNTAPPVPILPNVQKDHLYRDINDAAHAAPAPSLHPLLA